MSIEEKKSGDLTIANQNLVRYRINPQYGSWIEGDKIFLEVALPGVKKENIQLKALEDFIMLRGIRDNLMYSLDLDLSVKIEPEKTKSNYNEGLLRVEMKRYKVAEHMFDVPVNGKKKEPPSEKSDPKKLYTRIYPEASKEINYHNKTINIEVALPGVSQDVINLKVAKNFYIIEATRDNILYRANKGFSVEIVPEKTTATYSDGLLKIQGSIRDRMDEAKELKL